MISAGTQPVAIAEMPCSGDKIFVDFFRFLGCDQNYQLLFKTKRPQRALGVRSMHSGEAFLVVTPKNRVYEDPRLLDRLKQHLEASLPGKRFLVTFEPLVAKEGDTFVVLPIVGENNGSGRDHDDIPGEVHRRMALLIMAALNKFDPSRRCPTVH